MSKFRIIGVSFDHMHMGDLLAQVHAHPAAEIADMMKSSASAVDRRFGAKPPSSPTPVLWPAFFNSPFRVWKISEPIRTASAMLSALTGMIMNS